MFDDGPRFYAAVELAGTCLETGVDLFLDDDGGDENAGGGEEEGGDESQDEENKVGVGAYGTAEEAKAMSDVYERIECKCGQLKMVVRAVFTNPHLRRAKELLNRFETHCRHKKAEASMAAMRRDGGIGVDCGGIVQKSLEDMWGSSGNAEESQEL